MCVNLAYHRSTTQYLLQLTCRVSLLLSFYGHSLGLGHDVFMAYWYEAVLTKCDRDEGLSRSVCFPIPQKIECIRDNYSSFAHHSQVNIKIPGKVSTARQPRLLEVSLQQLVASISIFKFPCCSFDLSLVTSRQFRRIEDIRRWKANSSQLLQYPKR